MSVRQTSGTRKFAGKLDSKTSSATAFVGLGAMGFDMAFKIVKIDYQVVVFDIYEPTRARFTEAGGKTAQSRLDAARGSDFMIFML